MARYFENTTVFNFTWDQVAYGYWNRYPNPHSQHVLSEDVVSRELREGKLHTKRLLTKTNRVPKWGERFFNAKSVKIVEESIVDPKNKLLITYTRNLGYAKVMSVVERVVYREMAGGRCEAKRSAWIDSQVLGFSRAIRAFGIDRFRKNCNQMVMGFNHVLMGMFPRPMPQSTSNSSLPLTASAAALKGVKEVADRATANVYASVQPNKS
ncbi:preli-like [Arctopsyche grandis]|uniref:preli-like n=1 Tax=Arctopsyche grandis TaxID=121162 RepID=UPI00406D65A8